MAAYSPAAPMATARGLVQPPLKRAGSDATQPSCSACGMRLIGTEALHFCVLVDIHRWIVSGVRFVPPAFPPDFRGDTLIMVVRPQGLRTACCSVGMLQQRCPAACVQTDSLTLPYGRRPPSRTARDAPRRHRHLASRSGAVGSWQHRSAASVAPQVRPHPDLPCKRQFRFGLSINSVSINSVGLVRSALFGQFGSVYGSSLRICAAAQPDPDCCGTCVRSRRLRVSSLVGACL